ncbi:MAG: hypothetical protein ABFC77_04960 [Thermoguttaceae bacterium]
MPMNRNPRGQDPRFSKDSQDPPQHSPWSDDAGGEECEELPIDSSRSAFQRWLRKNPNAVQLMLAGGLSLAVIVLVIGWRVGWFHRSSPSPAPVAQSPTPKTPAVPSSSASKPAAATSPSSSASKAAVSTSSATNPAVSASPTLVQQPPAGLSDDLSKWTPADFVRARRENDSKLLQAVVVLGTRSRGDPSVVATLADLLKPPVPASATDASRESPPSSPIDPARLSEAVLTALGENGTDSACALLRQTLSSPDDSTVETVLKALAAHPNEKTEAVLLEAVLAPDALRPADRSGNWPAKQLRARAFELLKPTVSNAARLRLAETLAERLAWVPAGDPVRDFLLLPDPLNCAAQVVIYEKAGAIREVKAKLEQQLTDLSAAALADRLGVGDASQHESGAQAAFKPAALAELLWSGPLLARIESQLGESRSFEKQPSLVTLAATVPRDSTRAMLLRLLRKNWSDGPKTLDALGLFDRVVADPALVVLLKMGPRKDRRGGNSNARGRQPSPARQSTAASARSARQAQAEQDWWDASAKLVSAWRRRLAETASAQVKAAVESGRIPVAAKPDPLPDFVLGDNARVTAVYDFHWPPPDLKGSEKAAADDLLDVHYLRIEEVNKPKKAIAFYGRQAQARTNDARTMDRATWLDGQRTDAKANRRRSIDVFVTKSDTGGEALKDEKEKETETDLLIEVLTIEIKDPIARD